MDADGAGVRRLTDTAGRDGGPWFSPDARSSVWRAWYPETEEERVLWRESMVGNHIHPTPLDLWVMDADGANKGRLTDNGAANRDPETPRTTDIYSADWKE